MRKLFLIIFMILLSILLFKGNKKSEKINQEIEIGENLKIEIVCDTVLSYYLNFETGDVSFIDEVVCDTVIINN